MRKTREFETRFQKISVWKSDLATEFRVAGAIHAQMHRSRFLTGLAWDLIAAGALLHGNGRPKSILMLGVAGGTALRTLRHLLPEAELTGVDLDSELIELAKEEMSLSETEARIEIADAYAWMKSNRRKFDVIIDDLYLAGDEDVFRADECDSDWLSLVQKSLAPGGILALNLVIGTGHRAKQTATRKRLAALFPTVRSLTTPDSLNEVLAAGETVATTTRLINFTDHFDDWRDRMYWKRIKIRKLS
ncbi:MAG: methyltransferase domain-containing protein [Akkermansiaceae bacterium]|nr:methyltransferase domain-containing protein [Akkermansiaceae bacterium]